MFGSIRARQGKVFLLRVYMQYIKSDIPPNDKNDDNLIPQLHSH